jgi:hypothetical protein
MTEIYFINDYYVEATSWQNAAKSWLKYTGGASEVKFKAIDAMEGADDIFRLLEICTSEIIERAGIVKTYYYFDDYYAPEDEDFEMNNVN